jgi:hypothetical protein
VGAGTASLSKFIQEFFLREGSFSGNTIQIKKEWNHTMADALAAAHFHAMLRFRDKTAGGKFQPIDLVASANSDYYGAWLLPNVIFGPKTLRASLLTKGNSAFTGYTTAPTVAEDFAVSPFLYPKSAYKGPEHTIEGIAVYNTADFFIPGTGIKTPVSDLTVWSDSGISGEISGILSGSVIAGDETYAPAQVQMIEDETNFALGTVLTRAAGNGMAAAGLTAGIQYFPPPLNPQSGGASLFGIYLHPDGKAARIPLNAQKTLYLVGEHL